MDPPTRAFLLELLLDLANDSSAYLRAHAAPAVRISAALLVASSLAACSTAPSGQVTNQSPPPVIQPLSQEVRSGLPAQAGHYPIVDDSWGRDAQGIYHVTWLSGDARNTAYVSRLRLAQSERSELEVPAEGDPILYLPSQAGIPIGDAFGSFGGHGTWYPFYGIGSRLPGYYDPPTRALAPGGTVTGSRVSSAPAPVGERTVGLPHTVSGRAGGTGSGEAASGKSGAGVSESGKGVGGARSGGFSAGASA